MQRYHRQMLLPGIGEAGQERLRQAHALVVGCGALGSVIVDALARAGIGTLTLVDRDIVELTNLQRQLLYDENDVAVGMPKAQAAKRRVNRINSEVIVHAHVDDFSNRNAERFAENADIILDGLDNFETRYVLNDLAVMRGLPYVYGGAVGTTGVSMTVLPHRELRKVANASNIVWNEAHATPCLRCVFPEAPPPGTTPTCDTAGVLGPVVTTIAAHQATQAIKLITANVDAVDRSLLSIDIWTNEFRRFDVSEARNNPDNPCPCCVQGKFEYMEGGSGSVTTSLCGRNAVQITPHLKEGSPMLNLSEIAFRLTPHGRFIVNEYLLRGEFRADSNKKADPIELTLFPNGRAIIKGVAEPEVARSIYSKYIGT